METSELKVGMAVALIKFPLASTCGACSSSSALASAEVIVSEAGSDTRCRKVPDEAFVARTVHVPVAIGVIAPLPFMEHFAGVVVLNEIAPSPEPPLAVAVAL
jgi:hypothetical protein